MGEVPPPGWRSSALSTSPPAQAPPLTLRFTPKTAGVWRQPCFFSLPCRRRELVRCAGTCFASGLIGHGRSVPPPRPACALALAEMPGRPRYIERIPGYLGPGRVGKLLTGSSPYGAAGEEAAWRSSVPSAGWRHPGSPGVEESGRIGEGWVRLVSGAHG